MRVHAIMYEIQDKLAYIAQALFSYVSFSAINLDKECMAYGLLFQ